jgi:hypothetical protein
MSSPLQNQCRVCQEPGALDICAECSTEVARELKRLCDPERVVPCPCCKEPFPFWVLDANEGRCATCAIAKFSGKEMECIRIHKKDTENRELESRGLALRWCAHCHRRLVPVGDGRLNGRAHGDWNSRRYHKKCWKILKDEGAFDSSSEEEEES